MKKNHYTAIFCLFISSLAFANDRNISSENNIRFKNEYYNPQLTNFENLANLMAENFGYTAKLNIDDHLAEIVRLRVAQIGGCSYCLITHNRESRVKKIPTEKIDTLISWRSSDLFSNKEKAALSYAESLTYIDQQNLNKDSNNLKNFFSEQEIAELAAVIINMNVWTRLKLSQGATPMLER